MRSLLFYKWSTFLLLGINLACLSFMFFFRRPAPQNMKRERPAKGELAQKAMRLNDEQFQLFQLEAQQHISLMDSLNRRQKELLTSYFEPLSTRKENMDHDRLMRLVQQAEKTKIESTYQHFENIRKILKPNQYADFQRFMDRALRRILFKEKKNRRPPKDLKK